MEQYNFRLKEYRKIALKFYLAPWRVLVIDKCGALTRAAAKHTPQKTKQRNDRKTKSKARRRGAVPANPLGDRLPLLPPRMAFFHWFYSCSMYLLNLRFFGQAMVA